MHTYKSVKTVPVTVAKLQAQFGANATPSPPASLFIQDLAYMYPLLKTKEKGTKKETPIKIVPGTWYNKLRICHGGIKAEGKVYHI